MLGFHQLGKGSAALSSAEHIRRARYPIGSRRASVFLEAKRLIDKRVFETTVPALVAAYPVLATSVVTLADGALHHPFRASISCSNNRKAGSYTIAGVVYMPSD